MKKNKPPVEKKHLLQALSILAAIILWFAITYTEDPSISITINNIQLKTAGEKSLETNGLMFVNRDKLPGISLEVRGRRSDVKSILNSVTAKIDLSDITEAGEYSRDLTFDIPNPSVMITKKKTQSLSVTIEKSVSKDVPIYVQQTGADKNKEYLIKSTPSTENVTITGTQSDISKIKEVLVSVDISAMTSDISGEYPISFADISHNAVIPSNRITTNSKSVKIQNKIYLRKSVDIALDPGLDISGYQVIVKSFSKDKVEIGVTNSDYDKINTIYADFINGINVNTVGKYQMRLIVPEDVYCPSENEELTMTADIESITTEEVTLDIGLENIPAGMSATLNPPAVTVQLTGAKSKIQEVKAKVDLSGLDKGTFNIPVIFVTENTGVTVDSTPFASVTIQ